MVVSIVLILIVVSRRACVYSTVISITTTRLYYLAWGCDIFRRGARVLGEWKTARRRPTVVVLCHKSIIVLILVVRRNGTSSIKYQIFNIILSSMIRVLVVLEKSPPSAAARQRNTKDGEQSVSP